MSPATLLLHDVPVGESYDLEKEQGIRIRVTNNSDMGFTYLLKPERPSESGTEATGYFDFPEPDWCWFDQDTLEVEAGEEKTVRFFFRIPDSVAYYNRHWLIAIAVTPLSTTSGEQSSIALGAYLLYRIETESKSGIKPFRLENELITLPSMVSFDNVVAGEEYETTVRLLADGRDKVSVYRLDEKSDVAMLTILTTPGFKRMPARGWLRYDSSVRLNKQGIGDLTLRLVVPETEPLDRQYEELLLLERQSNGEKSFIRVRITPKKGGK